MTDYAKIQLTGRLTQDPEPKTGSERPLTRMRLAVNKKRRGEETTSYFTVFCYGRTAENCAKYLAKGSKVLVNGEPDQRIYKDRDGNPQLDLTVSADNVVFLSSPAERQPQQGQPQQRQGERSWGEPQPAQTNNNRGWSGNGSDPIPF